jgi:hypothetical protein
MSTKSFGGIDPGKDGGLAVIRPDGSVEFFDVPMAEVEMTKKTKAGNKRHKRVYLPGAMAHMLREAKLDLVTMEKTQAMPSLGRSGARDVSMGAVSAFASGEGYGLWQGILATIPIPYQLVHAATWKAALMAGEPKTKEATVPFAARLYPGASKDLYGSRGGLLVDRADALLIAHYGRIRYVT